MQLHSIKLCKAKEQKSLKQKSKKNVEAKKTKTNGKIFFENARSGLVDHGLG
jgi:hypothetical protein